MGADTASVYIGTDPDPDRSQALLKKIEGYLKKHKIKHDRVDGVWLGNKEPTIRAFVSEREAPVLAHKAMRLFEQDAVLVEKRKRGYLYWDDGRKEYIGLRQEHDESPLDADAYTALPNGTYVTFEKEKDPRDTQDFFSEVTTGGERHAPCAGYRYVHRFKGGTEKSVKRYLDKHEGPFDLHIATSIPTFRENQVATAAAIAKAFDGRSATVVDIGGSEGTWLKAVGAHSDIRGVNLDANKDMENSFHERGVVPGVTFEHGAFLQGWKEDDGTVVPTYIPSERFDVVHESMTFQFIDGERESKVEEVAQKYIKPDGLFLTEEKFKFPGSIYSANEHLKDTKHKAKYYKSEQVAKKAEEVLVGMESGQANYDEYIQLLKKHFKHVEPYWVAGNFRGVAASNSRKTIRRFLDNLESIPESKGYTFVPVGA